MVDNDLLIRRNPDVRLHARRTQFLSKRECGQRVLFRVSARTPVGEEERFLKKRWEALLHGNSVDADG
jgi:hypothetical protein